MSERHEQSPAMTPQQARLTGHKGSALALYRELAVGKESYLFLICFELVIVLLSNLAGFAGLALRALLFPGFLKRCGRRPAFGRGVLIRNPRSITLGSKVIVDDFAALDVRGEHAGIEIGDHAMIGRFSTLVAKGGKIVLHNGVNVGSYCRIGTQSRVEIGESTLIAAFCYIGPGNHQHGDDGRPLIEQPMEIRGGVKIGKHVWIGTGCTILDGVSIGDGAVVGAHSLVREDVPAHAVVAGTPARIIKHPNAEQAVGAS